MTRPQTVTRPELIVDGSDRTYRRLIYDLFALAKLIEDGRSRLARAAGLKSPQWSILMAIAEAHDFEGTTVRDIAEQLGLHSSFTVLHVGLLIKQGLVRQLESRSDGRSKILRLTKRGEALIRRMGPALQVANDTLFRSASAKDFVELSRSCRSIVAGGSMVLAAIELEVAKLPPLPKG